MSTEQTIYESKQQDISASIKETQRKIDDLKIQKEVACKIATAEIVTELSKSNDEMANLEAMMTAHNKDSLIEVSRIVAEMQRLSFLLFSEKGVSIDFMVSHHVQWIEAKYHQDDESYHRNWVSYGSRSDKTIYLDVAQNELKRLIKFCIEKGLTWAGDLEEPV